MVRKYPFAVATFASATMLTSLAFAQVPPATTPAPAAPATGAAPPVAPVPDVAPPPPPPSPPPPPVEMSDHDRFIHHIGVTYFDITNLPIATAAGTSGTVPAPIVGVRYWFGRAVGLDAGIGIGWQGGSSTVNTGVTTTTTDAPSPFGFAAHIGVPISIVSGQHYSFLVIPETTFGFATETISMMGAPDVDLKGTLFRIGGRVGGEINFGFIGVPELALQATVGLFLEYQGTTESTGNTSASTNSTMFTTTVGGTPWAIFTNTISATYYL